MIRVLVEAAKNIKNVAVSFKLKDPVGIVNNCIHQNAFWFCKEYFLISCQFYGLMLYFYRKT
jgi:hypothetical protein